VCFSTLWLYQPPISIGGGVAAKTAGLPGYFLNVHQSLLPTHQVIVAGQIGWTWSRQLTPSDLLLILSPVIIVVLLGAVIYLSRPKAHDGVNDTNNKAPTPQVASDDGLSVGSSEIYTPGPPSQPGLEVATSEAPQYRRRRYLFSYQEGKFYDVLSRNFGEEVEIFAKVRMADIVDLANEPKDRGRYINLILTRHIDFVMCDKLRQRPLLGIELDDSSHTKYDRAESDKFKKSVFEQVGLDLLRFDVRKYTNDEVVDRIRKVLAKNSVCVNAEGQSRHG
jgi:hypothetical protein